MPTETAPLSAAQLADLAACVGAEQLLTAPEECWVYGYDNSRQHTPPQAVVFAQTHEQIARLAAYCHQQRIPLTVRGAGTGTNAAAVPVQGGVVLSMERMNRIIEFNPSDRLMVVEAGVTNQAVQERAATAGFFWPPDPTSAATCTVGGNIAFDSGGPKAVKYGTTKDHVLGLKAVTAQGETLVTGVRTTKGVVGYDLTRLLIGSEGTLAIVTEATLRLTPQPQAIRTLRAAYDDIQHAAQAVAELMAQPVIPRILELIDGNAIELVRQHQALDLPAQTQAILMLEVDGSATTLAESSAAIEAAAHNAGLLELRAASTAEETAALWSVRKALSPTLRHKAPKKINEDVVVPVSRIPELIEGLEIISKRFAIPIVNFGHAGNGNIHTNLLFDPEDATQARNAPACLDAVFDLVLSLGGTLSGEHGIGRVKCDYVDREIGPEALRLMRALKQEFDPHHILNPGKIFPDLNRNQSDDAAS